ncbi:hypothetical protein ACHHYP_12053 [Achlya hypogyna]|uniref:WW domain-containing protein n=1 Tax=Achlya hypogyna TaxID=1202772 RepID=A0A1V9YHQ4_ACHHY|nr:hypothetical protein ACHHYP_12053 [Achlya hypogyna]
MTWEARCNQQGYTYYVNTTTGVMQWASPAATTPYPEAEEAITIENDAQSSSSSDIADSESGDECETLLTDAKKLDRSLGLPRLVQTTIYRALSWVVWEAWQSHREFGAFVARAAQVVINAVPVPQLASYLLHPPRPMLVHPQAIPPAFIPGSPKSASFNTTDADGEHVSVEDMA